MKNYALYDENSVKEERFFKKFKVKNGKIIARLANNEKYVAPDTEKNQNKILDRMEKQVRNFSKVDSKIKANISRNSIIAVLAGIVAIVSGSSINFALFANVSTFTKFVFLLTSITSLVEVKNVVRDKIALNDLKKQTFFLDNKDYLNNNVNLNENILHNISKAAVYRIKKSKNENEVFDINSIDKYSLTDLKTIRNIIAREVDFNLEHENGKIVKEKSKVKVKNR